MVSVSLKDKYINHIQSLVSQWENFVKLAPPEDKKYYELYERSKSILKQICPDDDDILIFDNYSPQNVYRIIGKLRAIQLDLKDGLLFLEKQIQGEIAIDFMGIAAELLNDDGLENSNYSYLPAAVLTGAVLEHFLRTLCLQKSPPIPLKLENGNFKTLAVLVNDLEKYGLYNAVQKKQLKVWVEIRNAAAHAQFDKFSREQVLNMIKDVKCFIEDYS